MWMSWQRPTSSVLPGSKSTLDDLYELRRNGVAAAITRATVKVPP